MPIKPENKARYPANWKAIRAAILERAGNCCERCGVQNHTWIERSVYDPARWRYVSREWNGMNKPPHAPHREHWRQPVAVVLTTAHLDHDLTHDDGMDDGGPALPVAEANLKALCQLCHNRHDADYRQRNAGMTRFLKRSANTGQRVLL
jgi:5-methylcytosine-specific restriction endonuclease McrA